MIKAAAAALSVGVLGFTAVTLLGMRQPVAYSFGWYSVVGGAIFGTGMVLAGGCASSSLWRSAEGHVQLWLALAAFAVSGAVSKHALYAIGFERTSGLYLPDVLGEANAGVITASVVSLAVVWAWWKAARRAESRLGAI